MPRDFQKFLFRGNLIDLAVAVVIGTAFSAVVAALVKDLITPLIAALVGSPHFGALSFTVHRSLFDYGDFLNALLTFVLVAAAVFYVVVLPMNLVQARGRAPQDPATKPCPECLSQIPTAAKRCAFCTSVQP
jgi:large conductance mechanosensitive channel